MHHYNSDFYSYTARFAVPSAKRIIPILRAAFPVRSVVDFGCGEGAWLQLWAEAGASVLGVDGPYVERHQLLIDPANFCAADLAEPIELGRKFDIVQSLEVAEHLAAGGAPQFIDTLTRHGSVVLFSAAVPGQGGENHVNEQPLGFWRRLFRERGYAAVDFLRPLICNDPTIARWYRYNAMLYIRDDVLEILSEPVQRCLLPEDQEADDYWPLKYRLRHVLIRRVPTGITNGLAHINAARAARAVSKRLSRPERGHG